MNAKAILRQWSFIPPPHLLLLSFLHLRKWTKKDQSENRHLTMSQDKFHLYCSMCVKFIFKVQPLFKLLQSNLLLEESITVPDNLVTCEMHAYLAYWQVFYERDHYFSQAQHKVTSIFTMTWNLCFFSPQTCFYFLLRALICTCDTKSLSSAM